VKLVRKVLTQVPESPKQNLTGHLMRSVLKMWGSIGVTNMSNTDTSKRTHLCFI